MIKMKHFILAALLLVGAVAPAAATIYYVSPCDGTAGVPGTGPLIGCVAGNDANTSTQAQDPSTPWRTLTNITASSLSPNDRVKIAKGGKLSFTASKSLNHASATDTNPIIIESYTPSWATATESGTFTSFGANTATRAGASWATDAWKGYGVRAVANGVTLEYMFVASNTSTTLTLTKNWVRTPVGTVTYVIEAPVPLLSLDATVTCGSSETQVFSLSSGGGIVIRELGFIATGNNASCSFGAFYAFGNSGLHDVRFERNVIDGFGSCFNTAQIGPLPLRNLQFIGNTVRGCVHMGLLVATSYSNFEDNNLVDNASSLAVGDHHFYAQCKPDGTKCIGNSVRRNRMLNSSAVSCNSAIFVQHDRFGGLVFEDNEIGQTSGSAQGQCYGVALTQGNGDTEIEGCEGCKVRRNVINNVGYIGMEISQCRNCEIESNAISWSTATENVGIRIGGFAASANDYALTGTVPKNNTIYMANPVADSNGIQFGPQASGTTGHGGYGNLVVFGNNANIAYCYFSQLATSAFAAGWNYNGCYVSGGSSRYASWNGTAYTSLSAFNAATGFDAGGVSSDPALVVPSASNRWRAKMSNPATSPVRNSCTSGCADIGVDGMPIGTATGAFGINN